MRYRRYWDDQEYVPEGLVPLIAAAIRGAGPDADPDVQAAAVAAQVFERVKIRTWCGRPGCFGPGCTPTHWALDASTAPAEFAGVADD